MCLSIVTKYLSVRYTLQSDHDSHPKKARMSSELEHFDSLFPDIVADLTEDVALRKEIGFALDWFKQVSKWKI